MAQDRKAYETKKAALINRLTLLANDEKRVALKTQEAKASLAVVEQKLAEIDEAEKKAAETKA